MLYYLLRETMQIKKAVIPAAGFGTRFLPWTKAMPKEMLPIVDKPVIQWVVEEAVEAGIEQIIIITGWHKRGIEDHFDNNIELQAHLRKAGKTKELKALKRISQMADFVYLRQKGPYGNATPVLSAQDVVGEEPFVVLWGDQFIWSKPSRLKQVLQVYEKYKCPVISGIRVSKERLPFTGIGRIKPYKEKNLFKLLEIVEKPTPEKAPSDLSPTGCYLLTSDIFPILRSLTPGKGGEVWLVDGITKLCKKRLVLVKDIVGGIYYDAGSKLNYHQTVVDFMLKDKEIGEEMRRYLKSKIQSSNDK